jgi:Ca2+-binding EF-hand superfamily protein
LYRYSKDVHEFAKLFEIESENPFLPRLAQLFDVSGDGQMSVFEFVVCLSQFSTSKSHQEHIYFAWRLFDTDDSGAMTKVRRDGFCVKPFSNF